MPDLKKTEQINLRISALQREWLDEAARIISTERGEKVEVAALARELVVAGVNEIRAKANAA